MIAARLDRRTLLKGGLAGAALVSVGATGFAVTRPLDGLVTLSALEAAVVGALLDAMFPGDPFPVGGGDPAIVANVDRVVTELLPPLHATAFKLMLSTLEWGTLASRGARFSALDRTTRTDVLHVWSTPGVLARRVAFDALKAILGMAYFSNPAVQAHMGWRGECAGGLA